MRLNDPNRGLVLTFLDSSTQIEVTGALWARRV